MIYTLCIDASDFTRDIKVNEEQKIIDTIRILIDGNIIRDYEKITIFSERKNMNINLEQTYKEAEILNGDILHIS